MRSPKDKPVAGFNQGQNGWRSVNITGIPITIPIRMYSFICLGTHDNLLSFSLFRDGSSCYSWPVITGSVVHARMGGVQVQLLHRVDNSRNLRILGGICRLPGGLDHPYQVRAFHRMHRCFHRYNLFERVQLIHRC